MPVEIGDPGQEPAASKVPGPIERAPSVTELEPPSNPSVAGAEPGPAEVIEMPSPPEESVPVADNSRDAVPSPSPPQPKPVATTAPHEPAQTSSPAVGFLRPGEVLEFRMSWGILSNIGETRIETSEETVDGVDRLRIRISTKSKGILDAIYPVVNDSETILERSTGLPLEIMVEGKSGSRPTKTHTVFNYEEGRIEHTDFLRPARSGTAELPDEPAYDLMVAMLKSREWHMKPGEQRDVLTAFEDEFYFITLTAHQRERVKTRVGTFDAVMTEPTQNGEQKGFFKRGGSMRYWLTEGEHPQVVKMVFKTKAGTLTAILENVTEGLHAP